MKNFSYIHVEKLKVWGRGVLTEKQYKPNKYKRYWGVQGCWEHDLRIIDTANADPRRLETNGIACEETQWQIVSAKKETLDQIGASSPTFISSKTQKFLHEKNIKTRDDQVKVAMLLCAASPEYLRDGNIKNPLNNKKVLLWAKTTVAFLKKMYQDQLVACIIHRDELNPHLTAYVIPALERAVKKRGPKTQEQTPETVQWTLNASKLFTPDPKSLITLPNGKIKKVHQGRGTCSILQDLYAQALQDAGLEIRRGVRRAPHQTGLPHQSTKDRWEALSAPIPEVDLIPENKLREWAKKLALQAENSRRFLQEKTHYQEAASHAIGRIKKAAQLLRKLKKEKHRLQKTLNKTDKVPTLEETFFKLTGLQTKETLQGKILTFPTGQKLLLKKFDQFVNTTPNLPGLGSKGNSPTGQGHLDAIIYTTGWNTKEALQWLSNTFSPTIAAQILAKNPETASLNHQKHFLENLAKHDETQWPKVFKILIEKFRFNPSLLQKLKENRWIGANRFGHLTFGKIQLGPNQKPIPTGKFIQDLTSPNGFQHETGQEGISFLTNANATETLLSTTPLEALALKHLHPQKSILLISETPQEITNTLLEKRRETTRLEIAEILNPSESLKTWIQTQIQKGASLLPLPLGVQSFLDAHLKPNNVPTPSVKILESLVDEIAPSQTVDDKPTKPLNS